MELTCWGEKDHKDLEVRRAAWVTARDLGSAGEQVVTESVDLGKSLKETEACEKGGGPVMKCQGNQY